MKTALHSRNRNVRDLYRAVPVSRDRELRLAEERAEQELIDAVARAYKTFWAKRGYNKPPRVSKVTLYDFDVPNQAWVSPMSK
jgi:hypothetical protein